MPRIGSLEIFAGENATATSFHDGRREIAIIVVRHGATLCAYEDSCPHQYLPLTYRGKQVLSHDGRRLRCSNHGAEFAVADGRALTGPGRGEGLTRVPIRLTADGRVIAGDD
jgi:nitrite reductase/ring-hydroxylating ferredoxin subunit